MTTEPQHWDYGSGIISKVSHTLEPVGQSSG